MKFQSISFKALILALSLMAVACSGSVDSSITGDDVTEVTPPHSNPNQLHQDPLRLKQLSVTVGENPNDQEGLSDYPPPGIGNLSEAPNMNNHQNVSADYESSNNLDEIPRGLTE